MDQQREIIKAVYIVQLFLCCVLLVALFTNLLPWIEFVMLGCVMGSLGIVMFEYHVGGLIKSFIHVRDVFVFSASVFIVSLVFWISDTTPEIDFAGKRFLAFVIAFGLLLVWSKALGSDHFNRHLAFWRRRTDQES